MDTDLRKPPAHVLVYQRIREMILCGELAPGQAVTIQGLVSVLGAGMTPVREAIRRLTSEGALQFQGNRRVCVPELTVAQIDELSFARLAIEPQLAYWAAEKITPEAIYKLDLVDQALNAAIVRGDVRDYMYQNYRFHASLYAVSEAHIMIPIANTLWLRAGPSLRVMCGRFGTLNLPDMHQEALRALRAADPQAVADAIHADLQQGLINIRAAMTE
ncbi:GntR family transcriptional regulator [Actibacterium sp. D379-3]